MVEWIIPTAGNSGVSPIPLEVISSPQGERMGRDMIRARRAASRSIQSALTRSYFPVVPKMDMAEWLTAYPRQTKDHVSIDERNERNTFPMVIVLNLTKMKY